MQRENTTNSGHRNGQDMVIQELSHLKEDEGLLEVRWRRVSAGNGAMEEMAGLEAQESQWTGDWTIIPSLKRFFPQPVDSALSLFFSLLIYFM